MATHATGDADGPTWPLPEDIKYDMIGACVRSFQGPLVAVVQCPASNQFFERIVMEFNQHCALKMRSNSGLQMRMEWEHAG